MQIKTGIKKMVEFILRSGSIDSRFTGTDRALIGARLHRKIQKSYGQNYQREKSLRIKIDFEDIQYDLYGRADGIISDEDGIMIDEIKTVSIPLAEMDENFNKAHWAQGCFYRYIMCVQSSLEKARVQLTYCNIDTEDIKRIVKLYNFTELQEVVFSVLKEYRKWAVFASNWKEKRTELLKNTVFPFSRYRKGQRQLAVSCYKVMRDGRRLFACAPTGTGKTMSTVFPALKAMGEEITDKVFYLTAKNSNGQAALDALNILSGEETPPVKTIAITAKDKMCFLEKRKCDPVSCPYAKGYFDRISGELFQILQDNSIFTADFIMETAREKMLCPYELSLDISEWCDFIICDYNYLFDPTVRLIRFFENKKSDYVFLVDEAHNLPDRARQMYSSQLDKKSFFEVKKRLGKSDKLLSGSLNEINKFFLRQRHRFDGTDSNFICDKEIPAGITKRLNLFLQRAAEYFDRHKNEETDENLLQIYFDAKFFMRVTEMYNDKYVSLIIKNSDNIILKLYCTDPSDNVSRRMDCGKSAVMFSATLQPLDYYRNLLGAKGEMIQVPSPFPQENMGLFIADKISTKYADRQSSLPRVCEMIHEMVSAKSGNYIAYFPSYEYMISAVEEYGRKYPYDNVITQNKDMSAEDRQAFLDNFSAESGGLLAFCVMGGIYGEGIDLTGEKLIGCAIVGVGLARPSVEQDIIKDYHNRHSQDGYAFAYQYPGMNKVMQAAGRVIRTDSDRGVVLLIDQRFSTVRYLKNMPPHWSHRQKVADCRRLKDKLKIFWNIGS